MAKKATEIGWSVETAQTVLDTIRPGDRVTITDRFDQESVGRAVMQGSSGWVLNMGGPHGTPAVATTYNIVAAARGWPGKRLVGHPIAQKEREKKLLANSRR